MHQIADVFGAIVVVALATTLVSHKGTASVITATGDSFAKSLRAAQGH